jgi:hypothetical protein
MANEASLFRAQIMVNLVNQMLLVLPGHAWNAIGATAFLKWHQVLAV